MNITRFQGNQQSYSTGLLCLYHVTTRYRLDLIVARGLDPYKSRGKKKVIWLVNSEKVAWAIAHVSIRHNVPVENIRIQAVYLSDQDIYRAPNTGVYCLPEKIYVNPALNFSARAALKKIQNNQLLPVS